MLQHAWMRNLKFSSVTTLIKCCVGTRNNGTLDVDPRRHETQSAIRLEVDPKGVSSFPERCGSAARLAKPGRQRDESNLSMHAIFRHPHNKGRSRLWLKRRTHSEKSSRFLYCGARAMRISRARSRACRPVPKSPSRRHHGFSSSRLSRLSQNRQVIEDNSNMPTPLRSKRAASIPRRENISASASIEWSLVAGVA